MEVNANKKSHSDSGTLKVKTSEDISGHICLYMARNNSVQEDSKMKDENKLG